MIKTYTLVEDQSDKIDKDNVEVVITKEETFTEDFHKTAGQLKAEIAKLDTKLTVVAEAKAVLEAELVELEKEADKYELKLEDK